MKMPPEVHEGAPESSGLCSCVDHGCGSTVGRKKAFEGALWDRELRLGFRVRRGN